MTPFGDPETQDAERRRIACSLSQCWAGEVLAPAVLIAKAAAPGGPGRRGAELEKSHPRLLLAYTPCSVPQELRSREEELTRAALQQKSQEALLKRREQQLAEREIDVLERELNILIFQLNQEKPNVKKRKGKFRRSRLKLKDGHRISLPSGMRSSACVARVLNVICVMGFFVVSSPGRDGRMRFFFF